MSLWSRLFGRRAATLDRRASNDWKAGDLAVCVDGDHWFPGCVDDPKTGEILRVSGVYEGNGRLRDRNVLTYFLNFEERPGSGGGWEYTAFRKAVEDSEPAEAEFTALIKRPVRKPALTPIGTGPGGG